MSDFSVHIKAVTNTIQETVDSIKTQVGKLLGRLITFIGLNKNSDPTTAKVAQFQPNSQTDAASSSHTYSPISEEDQKLEEVHTKIVAARELLHVESDISEAPIEEPESYELKDLLSEPEIPKGPAPNINKLQQAADKLAEAQDDLDKADKQELEKLEKKKVITPESNKPSGVSLDAEQQFYLDLLEGRSKTEE